MSTSRTVLPPNNAAAYVRMSTEHQQYSTSNQMDVIREYAKRRGLEIVMLYSDEGKSGLNIQGRDSLAQMLRMSRVEGRNTPAFWCTMSADGAGSRMLTKAPITSTFAGWRGSRSIIARSSSKTMGVRFPQ